MSDPLQFETKEQFNTVLDAYKTGKYDNLDPAAKELIGRSLVEFNTRYEADETFRAVTNIYRGPIKQSGAPRVDTRGMDWKAGMGPPQKREEDDDAQLLQQAANSGFDIKTGAPLIARTIFGALSFDSELAIRGMEEYLRGQTKAPPGVPVLANDPNTGYLAYLRTINDKDVASGEFPEGSAGKYVYTLVDPSGLDLGDAAEYIPDLPADIAELAVTRGLGNVVTTTGKAVAGSAASAGGLQYLSVPLKKELAKQLGVSQETLDSSDTLDAAIEQAVIAAGGDLAIAGLGKSITAIRSRNRFIKPEQMSEIAGNIRRIDEIRNYIKDKTGVDIALTTGERSGIMELLSREANVRSRLKGKARAAEEANVIETRENVASALRIMTDNAADAHVPFPYARITEIPEISQDELGKRVAGEVRRPAARAIEEVRAAGEELSENLGKIPDVWDPKPFVDMRQSLDEIITYGKAREDAGWNNFNNLIRVNPKTGESGIRVQNSKNSPVMQALSKLSHEQSNDLFSRTQKTTESLVKGVKAQYTEIAPGYEMQTKFGLNDETIDIRALHILRSNLDQLERDILAGSEGAVGWNRNQIVSLRSSVDEMLRTAPLVQAGGKPVDDALAATIRETYETAAAITDRQKNLLEHEGIRAILKTEPVFDPKGNRIGTRFKDSPEAMTSKIINDPSLMAKVMDITGQSPDTRAALAGELLRRAKAASYNPKTGEFQRGKWQEFVNQHYSQMNTILGDNAPNASKSILAFDMAVQETEKRARAVEEAIRKNYGPKFADLKPGQYPTSIIEDALSNNTTFTAEQVGKLVRDVSRADPVLGAQLRRSAGDWVVRELTQRKEVKSSDTIAKLIGDQGARLDAIFGPQYTKDLGRIKEIMQTLERGAKANNTPEEKAVWWWLTRNYFGPLSTMQRYLTTGERYGKIWDARKGLEIMRDPKKLHLYLQLEKLPPGSYAQRVAATRLGLEQYFGGTAQEADAGDVQPSLVERVSSWLGEEE